MYWHYPGTYPNLPVCLAGECPKVVRGAYSKGAFAREITVCTCTSTGTRLYVPSYIHKYMTVS